MVRVHVNPSYKGKNVYLAKVRKQHSCTVQWNNFLQPLAQIKNLHHEGTILEYQRRFDNLLHKVGLVEPILERATITLFLRGLEHQL